MSAAATIGAVLCWLMPATTVTPPTEIEVKVIQPASVPATAEHGAWVEVTTGRLAGVQWLVRAADLRECKR